MTATFPSPSRASREETRCLGRGLSGFSLPLEFSILVVELSLSLPLAELGSAAACLWLCHRCAESDSVVDPAENCKNSDRETPHLVTLCDPGLESVSLRGEGEMSRTSTHRTACIRLQEAPYSPILSSLDTATSRARGPLTTTVLVRPVLGKVDPDRSSVDADPPSVARPERLLRRIEVLKLDKRDAGTPTRLGILGLVDPLDVAVPPKHLLEGDLVRRPGDVADVDGRPGRVARVRTALGRVLFRGRVGAPGWGLADGGFRSFEDGFAVGDDEGRFAQELLDQVGRGELDKGETATLLWINFRSQRGLGTLRLTPWTCPPGQSRSGPERHPLRPRGVCESPRSGLRP